MPTPSLRRGLPAILLALLVFLLARPAHAGVDLEVSSILGDLGPSQGEILVRIRNPERRELRGFVAIEAIEERSAARVLARTPFVVGAATTTFVKVPVAAPAYGSEIAAVARDESGGEFGRASRSSHGSASFVLFEIPPRDTRLLPLHVDGRAIPLLRRTGGSAAVTTAPADEAAGASILPDRPTSYTHVALVIVPASELDALDGAGREALVAWVMGGGSLAIAIREPADLVRPALI